jgi:hypothetical protein
MLSFFPEIILQTVKSHPSFLQIKFLKTWENLPHKIAAPMFYLHKFNVGSHVTPSCPVAGAFGNPQL